MYVNTIMQKQRHVQVAANIISMSAILLFLLPWGFYVATNKTVFLWLGVVSALADGSTKIWKKIFGVSLTIFERPIGACDCDILCMNGDQSEKRGFPSGHMTITSVVLFSFAIIYHLQCSWIILTVLAISIMGWARYVKRCHNLAQISAGTLYGFFVATFFTAAYTFLYNDQTLNAIL